MEAVTNFTLTDDQKKALQEIKDWLSKDPMFMIVAGDEDQAENSDKARFKVLQGFAGTGKTTLLNYIVAEAKKEGMRIIVTATTNKAVKVLVDRVDAPDYATIHSVLRIRPKEYGEKEVFEPDRSIDRPPLASYDLVIVDECSMISQQLLQIIRDENPGHVKVLFCGDPAQLQPINETISHCFSYSPSTLKEVVRHGSAIANKATLVRQEDRNIDHKELLDGDHISVIKTSDIYPLFESFRLNPDRIRMLSWTNKRVHHWNDRLRMADYGRRMPPFTTGDIIMANKPCIMKEEIVLMNSEEGVVQNVHEEETHYVLSVLPNGKDKPVSVRVLKKEYEHELNTTLRDLAIKKDWRRFWKLKRTYHDIRHCYAMTVHKSQGSTFDSVIIDWNDVYQNTDDVNRNQLVYVGMTRAAKRVYIHV